MEVISSSLTRQPARAGGTGGIGSAELGAGQRPPNYPSKFARWPLEGFSSPIPGAPSSEGVASCSLDGGMETRHLHAPVKKPIEKLLPLAVGRDRRRRALASCHVTACLIHLHYPATTSRPSRRGRPSRPSGPARRSGAHPELHPLELSPTSTRWPERLELRGSARLCCSRVQAGVCACQPLRADAPRVLRCAAAQNPLQHAFTCLRTSLCTLLCGARRTVCSCASCVRSEAWWRVCAVLCMVSSAP